jgi:predicted nucleotide-binding protein
MLLKELELLSEALWESIKKDLGFFSPIQVFVKRLAETDFSDIKNLSEIKIYVERIEEFFSRYRPTGDGYYFPPRQTASNDKTVKDILKITNQISSLSTEELEKEIEKIRLKKKEKSIGDGKIFIGHGRSKLWARVQLFLQDDLKLETLSYESESRTSQTIINILEDILSQSSYAILIMTAEDETSEGNIRARQNVIHESGLFQGRLGFDKVIILKQNNTEDFSNVAGLQYIAFQGDNIEQTFYELQRKLVKLGLKK